MNHIFETIIGFLVLFIAATFTYFAYQSSGKKLEADNQYTLVANFDNIDGIKIGSSVKISGIAIGKVLDQSLDYDTYSAVLKLSLDRKIKLPEDSSALIVSSSLLGDKYISIMPGSEEKILKDGDVLEFTQSSINLEGLISKFLFGLKGNDSSNNGNEEDSFFKNTSKSNEETHIFNDSSAENSIS
jgi:phospholipid/cholesterol/gamma-HCH transport system substrate-binding protein